MRDGARRVGLAALLVLAAGCAAPRAALPGGPPPVTDWQSPRGRAHPLTGRVWEVDAGRFVDAAGLVERLGRARFVLLGERHDNADHHRLQAWIVRALTAAGRRPAVAFEMFETTQADAIARHLAAAPRDAAGLGDAVGWSRSGWPPWELYAPIARAALAAGLPIVAANLPRDLARGLSRRGLAALDRETIARLGLEAPLPPAVQTAMADEIRDVHCGQMPASALEGMVLAQRARDAQMARSLADGATAGGAVLIAGAGHVRRDHGVPAHLATVAPGAVVASVALVEVADGAERPADYAARWGGTVPFDHVWFTPRTDDGDPCNAFPTRPAPRPS